MRIVCKQTILMQYHALFVILEKSGKIFNCRLLKIIGGALRVNDWYMSGLQFSRHLSYFCLDLWLFQRLKRAKRLSQNSALGHLVQNQCKEKSPKSNKFSTQKIVLQPLLYKTLYFQNCDIIFPFLHEDIWGSVVECLTRDRGAPGSSLIRITALWSLSKTHLF